MTRLLSYRHEVAAHHCRVSGRESQSAKRWQRPNVFSLAVIGLLLAVYIAPFGDMDFGMLIRTGERIVETGQLRPPEGFSYTIAGADVPDHEWLFEIIIWAVWTVFGYGGLKLFKVLLVAAMFLLIGARLSREGVRRRGVALSLALAVVLTAGSWNLLPLYFTTIGLLVVSWLLREHCTGRKSLPWWLPAVMLIWANVHPGVITGQALLLGAILWEWLNRRLEWNAPLSRRASVRLTAIGGIALALSFVGPDPIGRLLCPFRPEVHDPVMRIFAEMRPLWEVALQPPYHYLAAYFLAALILPTVVVRFRHYRLWEIALLAGTALLANSAARGVQDWTAILLSVGVPQFVFMMRDWAQANRRGRPIAFWLRLDRACKRLAGAPLFRFQWHWPIAALVFIALISLIPPLGRGMPLQHRATDPVAATDWMAREAPSGSKPWRVFASPDNSSFLIWRLGPDRVRCYADTRGFCYPSQLIADSFLAPRLGNDWRSRLDRILKRGTDYFLLESTGRAGRLWRQLKKAGATPAYRDEKAVVLTAAQVQLSLARLRAENPPAISLPCRD